MNAPASAYAGKKVITIVHLNELVGGHLGLGGGEVQRQVPFANIQEVRESFFGNSMTVAMTETAPGVLGNEAAIRDMNCPTGQGLRKLLEQSGDFVYHADRLGRDVWTREGQDNTSAIQDLADKHVPTQNVAKLPAKGRGAGTRLGFNRFGKHCG